MGTSLSPCYPTSDPAPCKWPGKQQRASFSSPTRETWMKYLVSDFDLVQHWPLPAAIWEVIQPVEDLWSLSALPLLSRSVFQINEQIFSLFPMYSNIQGVFKKIHEKSVFLKKKTEWVSKLLLGKKKLKFHFFTNFFWAFAVTVL